MLIILQMLALILNNILNTLNIHFLVHYCHLIVNKLLQKLVVFERIFTKTINL